MFTFLPEFLRMAVFYRMLLYGIILLLVVMFMPRGLVFLFSRWRGASAPPCARTPARSRCSRPAPP